MNRRIAVASGIVAMSLVGGMLTGCNNYKAPKVESEVGSSENTSTLTPLEYGKIRREALRDTRVFTDAWMKSDAATMRKVAPDSFVKKFEQTWQGYEAQGLKIKHVHDVSAFDVTQFNNLATQGTVAYTYKDHSYLVDKNGKKVKSLPVIDEDASFTIERKSNKSDEWKVVRIFMGQQSYR